MIKKILFTLLVFAHSLVMQGQELNKIADSLMRRSNIPELGFAVITADKVLELNILGFHSVGQKGEEDKANHDDYFHLGSNTKAITGFVAACLVEKNKIRWETNFLTYFPSGKSKAISHITTSP